MILSKIYCTPVLSEIRKSIKGAIYAKQRARCFASLLFHLHFLLFAVLYSVPLRKCCTHGFDHFIRPVIFYFCIDVHGDLTALMSCQILNRLWIYRRMDQVCDIGVTELVWRHIKIQTINEFPIVSRFFSEYGFDGMCYTLPVLISVINPFLGRPGDNILPEPLKLRIGQGITVPVGNHILRSGACFRFFQTFCQTGRKRNIPLSGWGL